MFKNPLTRRKASTYFTAGVMFIILFVFIILMASGVGKDGGGINSDSGSTPNVDTIENVDKVGENLSSEDTLD